ncbi:MAG TPA: hypothetical protein VFK02_05745 [Kofleriaceae bacterium]|nr:hypothetical protein [Kofleriaceae bacterium]
MMRSPRQRPAPDGVTREVLVQSVSSAAQSAQATRDQSSAGVRGRGQRAARLDRDVDALATGDSRYCRNILRFLR